MVDEWCSGRGGGRIHAGGVRDQWLCVTNEVASFPGGMANFKIVLLGVTTAGVIYYDDLKVEVIPEPGLVAGGCLALLMWLKRR
ncbi:MAG: hypothetical protein NTV22_19005 [bacterium]|nr:hypothetical protein [bacterium]